MKNKSYDELHRVVRKLKENQEVKVSFRICSPGEGLGHTIAIESNDIDNSYGDKENEWRDWRWAIFLKHDGTWEIA